MNIVPLRQPQTMAPGFPATLRELADRVERGEVTEFVCAMVSSGGYEFIYPSSLIDSLTLSTLLHAQCVDRMRR